MKNSFIKGAFILGMAGIIVKFIGAFFRIPLGRIIGSEGLGYYQAGYSVFNFLLAFTAAGLPTAISKLVSEKRVKGDYKGAHKVFKTAFFLLLGLGLVGTIVFALITSYLVNEIFKNPNAYYAVMALAPALIFICLLAAFRGYFQGMKNMKPTATSQVVEQLARVTIGLTLAVVLLNKLDVRFAAAGASFGATAGGLFGLVIMLYIYQKQKNSIIPRDIEHIQVEEERTKQIIKNILKISIPISIGAAVMPLINMLDTIVVIRRLQDIGFTTEEANSLFGQLSGMATTMVNFPQVITVAIAMSVVPVISESAEIGKWDDVREDTKSAVKLALLIGLPAAVGLATLSHPIMAMLFPDEPASVGRILLFLSWAVIFLTQVQTLTGVLQGLGKPHIPVRNLIIGAGVKLVITYILTGIEIINVLGGAIGTVSAYFVAFTLNLIAVKKETGVVFSKREFLLKPILSAGIMGLIVLIVYHQLYPFLGNTIATLSSIVIGGITYGIMLLKTKTLGQVELELLPGSKKIIKVLRHFKLI
ncbi:polysaccharide biosynthesis protein [Serpentinicella sp. ANB-PHB4]|uniref:putative polysaccharide biosynthesis protein n=1 Tax=Serpentinicella sp. ANB-PHB4 TaxID=3074076 RepID=UPI002857079D|nr:polysaccharide biosynthesis protein [Serpentinicella sp. ANB-PHB4]MDR5659183.1 polysaccharide biosynthesis protein [Serpentinicella sp. ANB-PHB4]